MTPEENDRLRQESALGGRIDEPRKNTKRNGCINAMAAAFALNEAITETNLSIVDLQRMVELSVDDGHDSLLLGLLMMKEAVLRAQRTKAEEHARKQAQEDSDA